MKKYMWVQEEVCEYCGSTQEKFFVHLETPGRDFYWCDLECFRGDIQGWAESDSRGGTFVENLSDWQDSIGNQGEGR